MQPETHFHTIVPYFRSSVGYCATNRPDLYPDKSLIINHSFWRKPYFALFSLLALVSLLSWLSVFSPNRFPFRLFAHMGHPCPLALFLGKACHSCPHSAHFHQTLSVPIIISDGVNGRFFVGCHSFVISGNRVAKSLTPLRSLFFEQYGQPFFKMVLLAIVALHS